MAGFFSRNAVCVFAACSLFGPLATAQKPVAPDAGCMQERGSYTCNWSSFKLALEQAHTVGIQTGPMDRSTSHQLGELIGEMGKMHASEGQPADLTLLLIPVQPTGVNLGPGDHDLATLQVYAPGEGSSRGALLWVETYRGQGDRPWPAQVHALITQFENRLPRQR